MIWSVDGVRSLEFAEPRLTNRNQFSCTATLVLEGAPSSVELSMITPYRSMWFAFFRDLADDLADNPEGWKGQRVWYSEFEEITVACANEGGGLIKMTVAMWPEGDDDERSGTLTIRPEDIGRVRDELPQFLSLPAELR